MDFGAEGREVGDEADMVVGLDVSVLAQRRDLGLDHDQDRDNTRMSDTSQNNYSHDGSEISETSQSQKKYSHQQAKHASASHRTQQQLQYLSPASEEVDYWQRVHAATHGLHNAAQRQERTLRLLCPVQHGGLGNTNSGASPDELLHRLDYLCNEYAALMQHAHSANHANSTANDVDPYLLASTLTTAITVCNTALHTALFHINHAMEMHSPEFLREAAETTASASVLLLPALSVSSIFCRFVPALTALCESLATHIQQNAYPALESANNNANTGNLRHLYAQLLVQCTSMLTPLIYLPNEEQLRNSASLSAAIRSASALLSRASSRSNGGGYHTSGADSPGTMDALRGIEVLGLSMSDRWCLVTLLIELLKRSSKYDASETLSSAALTALTSVLQAAPVEMYNLLLAQQGPAVLCDCLLPVRQSSSKNAVSSSVTSKSVPFGSTSVPLSQRLLAAVPHTLCLFLDPALSTLGVESACPMPLVNLKGNGNDSEQSSALVMLRVRVNRMVAERLMEGGARLLHALLFLFTEICVQSTNSTSGNANTRNTASNNNSALLVRSDLLTLLLHLTSSASGSFMTEVAQYENGAVLLCLLNILQQDSRNNSSGVSGTKEDCTVMLILKNFIAAQVLGYGQLQELTTSLLHRCSVPSGNAGAASASTNKDTRTRQLIAFNVLGDLFHSYLLLPTDPVGDAALSDGATLQVHERTRLLELLHTAVNNTNIRNSIVDLLTLCAAAFTTAAKDNNSATTSNPILQYAQTMYPLGTEFGVRTIGLLDGVFGFVAIMAAASTESNTVGSFLSSATAVTIVEKVCWLLHHSVSICDSFFAFSLFLVFFYDKSPQWDYGFVFDSLLTTILRCFCLSFFTG